MGFPRSIAAISCKLDPATITWLAQLGTRPSVAVISAVDHFIKGCKADGNWTLLDRFWLFAQDNQTNSLTSIVNPTSSVATEVSSPGWTSLQGYTSNGTTSYINTNYTPSTDAVNFTQNSATQFIYSRTDSQEASLQGGGGLANLHATHLNIRNSSDQILSRTNGTTATGAISNTSSLGFFTAVRSSFTAVTFYRNGSSLGSPASNTSTGLATVKLYALSNNNNGTAANFSTRQIAVYGFGSGSINQATFYTRVLNLATELGFNV